MKYLSIQSTIEYGRELSYIEWLKYIKAQVRK